MAEHYRQTADVYNECYCQTYASMVELVLRKIRFEENDTVVDIGGGTGALTEAIYRGAKLKNNILCVEPSEQMLALGLQREGVSTLRSTAEEFFSKKENYNFDKALIIASIHHFTDTDSIFQKWAEWLQPGSVCLILTRPPETTLPFFRKAHALFQKSASGVPGIIDSLMRVGLNVDVSEERTELQMSKEQWYKMLRRRYMSNMLVLTDEEIEEGVAELENERFADKKDIMIYDNILAIVVCKA